MGDPVREQGQLERAAAELAKNRQAVARLAQSSDAKQLMALLQQQGQEVRQAAQAAAAGEPGQLMAVMEWLMRTREGAELVERIENQARQAGLE